MKNNLIKTFSISFLMFLSVFLFNIDGVKADYNAGCTCYYHYTYDGVIAEGYGERQPYKATQLVAVHYTADSADVVYSCTAGDSKRNDFLDSKLGENADPMELRKACGENDNSIERGDPFEVNSAYIAGEKCSLEACNSVQMKACSTWAGVKLVTKDPMVCFNGIHDLTAITQEQSEQIENSEDAPSTAQDLGIADIFDKDKNNDIDAIHKWGETAKEDYTAEDVGNPCSFINKTVKQYLNWTFWIITIVAVAILIIMTMISFVKAITSSEDKLRDALKHLIVRVIVVVIILLLPILVNFIIDIINNSVGIGTVKVGGGGDVYCDFTKAGTPDFK